MKTSNVFSHTRNVNQPLFPLNDLKVDTRQKMDGLILLNKLPENSIPIIFFDPQYRGILDKQAYGNEGDGRQKNRVELPQMNNKIIKIFLKRIEQVLLPTGHLMFWVDKFIVCNDLHNLIHDLYLQIVDMITWDKGRMGMGYRTRRYGEYLIILQKPPIRAKGIWQVHNIPDVWTEKIENGNKNHIHAKPIGLQKALIEAVSNKGDIIVDPASGGYSVMTAALETGRHFIGCDIGG